MHLGLVVCVSFAFSVNAVAAGRGNFFINDATKKVAEADNANDATQQTLNLNFSPENREKLRKALDDYARSVDHSHDQIEERRRTMQQSIEVRFLEADSDSDGTIDRQEATERLPQIARHFSQVDTNQDGVISLDELEEAQARTLERRKSAEAALDEKKQQDADANTTNKRKQAITNARKRAI